MKINGIDVTWLGHATFLLGTPEGKRLLVDPWLESSPVCPESFHDLRPDLILVTHGHHDHMGDLLAVARRSGAPTVCIFEIAQYLAKRGVDNAISMNKGGTVEVGEVGVSVSMTTALHSSSFEIDGRYQYLGEPAGFVVGFSNGSRFYIAGDTAVFGDMALIAQLHAPQVALLPIGDRFTMGPKAAALACALLGVDKVVPCHFGTFPLLTGTPRMFREELSRVGRGVEMIELGIG